MKENKERSGIKRVMFSLLALYSIPIHAVMFTFVLYIIKACTNLNIEMESFFTAFVFVLVVTILNTLSFLIDFVTMVLSVWLKAIPSIVLRFASKIMQLLLVVWFVGQIDGAIDAVTLSMYGQITFGFAVHIITAGLTAAKSPVSKSDMK